jgi:magnesium transporter
MDRPRLRDEASARRTLEPLAIHPLVLEDMVMEVNRPKVDNYGRISTSWSTPRAGTRTAAAARAGHGAGRALPRHLPRRQHALDRRGARRAAAAPRAAGSRPGPLLHFILDELVDHYLPIMDRIAEDVDQLEEQLFHPGQRRLPQRVVRLKRGMSALRRIMGPQRDTVLALTRDEFRPIPRRCGPTCATSTTAWRG